MEEGSLRVDANVSIRPAGSATLGTKTELKNMNSFRFLERGIDAEIARQEVLVREGGEVEQETLHYDPRSDAISSLRSKEEAHDYRYFPSPTSCRSRPPRRCSTALVPRCPSCPRAAPSASSASLSCPPTWRGCCRSAPSSVTSSRRRLALGQRRHAHARQLDHQRARREDRRPDPADTRLDRARSPSWSRWWGKSRCRPPRRGGARRPDRGRATQPPWSSHASRRGRLRRARGDRRAGHRRQPGRREKVRSGKGQAIGAIIGAVMRETKGRADGGEVGRLIRERIG